MRYLKLYFVNLKRAIICRLEYKKDAIIGIFSFMINNLSSILSIYFVVNSIPSLEGWSMYELGFLYGFTMIPVSLDHMFTDDLWNVAYWKVKAGEMDRYFLRPVPVLFQVISETFQPEAIGELIVGIVMIVICNGEVHANWSFEVILLLTVAAIFGALIITSIKIFTAALAFLVKRSGMITQIAYSFIDFAKYPISIYPKIIKLVMTFLIPFALVISYPIEVLLFNSFSPYLLILMIILCTSILFLLSLTVWNVCAKHYSSSGN